MQIEVIETRKKHPQRAEILVVDSLPPTKEEFVESYLRTQIIPYFPSKSLVKLSAAITFLKDTDCIPGWFVNCNGKFFFKDGKLL